MSAKPSKPVRKSRRPTGGPRPECDVFISQLEQDIERLEAGQNGGKYVRDALSDVRARLNGLARRVYADLDGWQTVQLARHPDRPTFSDYVDLIVQDFCPLYGDRCFGDDPAVTTGFGTIAGHRVMLVGHNKGRDTADRVARRFGHAQPEGFRKAVHKMKLAQKFHLPVVSWIDTPGAFPGTGAEERGIAQAIALSLREMTRLRVPVVSIVLGEGGSGGALGLAVGDRMAMLQHAYFSVITPEGCASILYKNTDRTPEAANALALRAVDLLRLGLIDEVIAEPVGGAHRNPRQAAASVEVFIGATLQQLVHEPVETRLAARFKKLRQWGVEHAIGRFHDGLGI